MAMISIGLQRGAVMGFRCQN